VTFLVIRKGFIEQLAALPCRITAMLSRYVRSLVPSSLVRQSTCRFMSDELPTKPHEHNAIEKANADRDALAAQMFQQPFANLSSEQKRTLGEQLAPEVGRVLGHKGYQEMGFSAADAKELLQGKEGTHTASNFGSTLSRLGAQLKDTVTGRHTEAFKEVQTEAKKIVTDVRDAAKNSGTM
jgi:hypothetical protein